jgi:hypothetical protein
MPWLTYAATVSSESVTGARSDVGLSEAELIASYRSAVHVGTAVHMVAAEISDARAASFDLSLNKDGSAASTVAFNGMERRIRAIAGSFYFQFAGSFPETMMTALAGARLDPSRIRGRWLSPTGPRGDALIRKLTATFTWNQPTRLIAPPPAEVFRL